MFTVNDGSIYNLLVKLYRFDQRKLIKQLETSIQKFQNLRLFDLMQDLKPNSNSKSELEYFESSIIEQNLTLFPDTIKKMSEIHQIKDPRLILQKINQI